MNEIQETKINIVSESTRLEGVLRFSHTTRIHGVIRGEIFAEADSILIFGETAMIEGNIIADTVVVDGYVRGDITARNRVLISRTGRVIGNVKAAALKLEFGAYFEGNCTSDGGAPREFRDRGPTSLKPA